MENAKPATGEYPDIDELSLLLAGVAALAAIGWLRRIGPIEAPHDDNEVNQPVKGLVHRVL
ncbi:hypothetical protein AMK27_36620 [Streptomyces sp. CB02009]|uniref:hypothetical protein n=1 Tax=Streptomyces sp. CB02009 TaxID=1703938 RepID=UPI000961484E|nr:hypothetical protein [Streptomyces sp. CB02009]OKJ49567.1 hypothetical protein AMK27_36620 [Streptomyces sp. CB02009]